MKENIERIRNRLLKVLHILKSPPPGTALAYGILSLIFVAVVLMTPLHRTPVAYISYALSAVGLCELVVVIVPGVRHIRQKLDEIPAVHRYNTDRLLKAGCLFTAVRFLMCCTPC